MDISSEGDPADDGSGLFDLALSAVKDAVWYIRGLEGSGVTLPRYEDYATYVAAIDWKPHSGSLRPLPLSPPAPTDYTAVLGNFSIRSAMTGRSKYQTPPSWDAFLSAVAERETTAKWFGLTSSEDLGTSLGVYNVKSFLAELTNRCIHENGLVEPTRDALGPIFVQWSHAVFGEDLPFEIVVPLVHQEFDFDSFALGPEVSIERMSEGVQRARFFGKNWRQRDYSSTRLRKS